MNTLVKKNKKQQEQDFADLEAATKKDLKVHITCRLDSDIYLELKRRARKGEGRGKYQKILNDALREVLFEKEENLEKLRQIKKILRKEASA